MSLPEATQASSDVVFMVQKEDNEGSVFKSSGEALEDRSTLSEVLASVGGAAPIALSSFSEKGSEASVISEVLAAGVVGISGSVCHSSGSASLAESDWLGVVSTASLPVFSVPVVGDLVLAELAIQLSSSTSEVLSSSGRQDVVSVLSSEGIGLGSLGTYSGLISRGVSSSVLESRFGHREGSWFWSD